MKLETHGRSPRQGASTSHNLGLSATTGRILASFVAFLLLTALALSTAASASAAPVFSYFPSASSTDGRMLSVAGDGLSTLSGSTVTLSFSVANTANSFQVGFFDGADMSVWDANTTTTFPTRYDLYADPLGNGTGSTLVASWTDATMAQNAWSDYTVTQSAAAKTPAGNYSYRLTVTGTTANATYNNFKVRVEGLTYITPTSVFGYMGAKASGITTDGAYDGDWDFQLIVPNGASYFGIWDGDFDYGPTAAAGDTDDPNTPATPPSWATASAQAEGAKGVGVPPDDNTDATLKRSPNICYDIILPNGQTFSNNNPSGTTEWEYFRLDTAPFNASVMDYHVDSLPPGLYHVHVKGLDWRNLNAFRFEYPTLSEDASGNPVVPPAPFLVGDTVWNDVVPDGIQDLSETGIAGVKVLLKDAVSGSIVSSTTTDATGHYSINSWNGSYLVQLDPSNFTTGGALVGFEATSPSTRAITITDRNISDSDFGVRLTPKIDVAPDRFGLAMPGGTILHTFTVRNNTGSAGIINLATLPDLGFPTQILNSKGTAISSVSLASGETTSVSVWLSVPMSAVIGAHDVTKLNATLSTASTITASAFAETVVHAAIEITPSQIGGTGDGSSIDYVHTVTNSTSTTQTVALTSTDSHSWTVGYYAADGTTPITNVVLGPNGGTTTVIARLAVPAGTAKGTVDTLTVRATAGSNTSSATDTTTVRWLQTFATSSYTVAASSFKLDTDVFGRGTGLATNRNFYFVWKNPAGTTIRTSTAARPNSSGVAVDTYHLLPTDQTGTWTLELWRSGQAAAQETVTFNVTPNANITSLFGTNAATIGAKTTIGSTTKNSDASTITASSVEYTIWWDTDGDGTFDSGDIAMNSAGTPVTYSGSGSVISHTSAGVTLAPGDSYTDPSWQMANATFPNRGTYYVTAKWKSSTSQVIDTKVTTFFSVPTLGEWVASITSGSPWLSLPLILIAMMIWAVVLVRFWTKRRWLLFYGTGALGTVLFTIALAQALGLDGRLAAIEATQVAWLAKVLNMRILQVSSSGLAIQNHIGWGVFDIGIECSALLELATFVGLAVFYPTFDPARKGGIAVVGLAATYVINLLRILLIVGMVAVLGTGWVFIAHAVVGRVFFFVGVVIVFWFLLTMPTVRVVRARLEGGSDA